MYPSVLGSSSFSFLNIGMCSPILVNRPSTVDIVMVCVLCVVSVLVTSYMLREVCRTVQAAGRLSYLPVPPRYHQGAALPSTTSRLYWLNILIKYKLFNVLACTSHCKTCVSPTYEKTSIVLLFTVFTFLFLRRACHWIDVEGKITST